MVISGGIVTVVIIAGLIGLTVSAKGCLNEAPQNLADAVNSLWPTMTTWGLMFILALLSGAVLILALRK
jgi:hypothetical protein